MTEFLIEYGATTYLCSYCIEDLTVVVTAAGRTRRVALQEMRASREAVAVARQLLAEQARPQVDWAPSVASVLPDRRQVEARPSVKQGSSVSVTG